MCTVFEGESFTTYCNYCTEHRSRHFSSEPLLNFIVVENMNKNSFIDHLRALYFSTCFQLSKASAVCFSFTFLIVEMEV